MNLYRGRERAAVARLLLDIFKIIEKTPIGRLTDRPAMSGLVFIFAELTLGHYAGKPRTANQIARSLGIPRSTVQRRLKELVNIGAAVPRGKTGYVLPPSSPENSDLHVDLAIAAIKKAAQSI